MDDDRLDRVVAGCPPDDTELPSGLLPALRALAVDVHHVRPVWLNAVGGLTFAISHDPDDAVAYYLKWNPHGSGESLLEEARRARWLAERHPVPPVVALWSDDNGEAMLTRALPGESAVSAGWTTDTQTALRALGVGLRRLHDLPTNDCPFDWGVPRRARIAGVDLGDLPPVPPIDKLVVSHGDPCAPNTLLAADGSFLAHVDLGRVGLADRWADLAVLSLSLEWNYAHYDEHVFWDAYGVEPDVERVAFYRELWNAQ